MMRQKITFVLPESGQHPIGGFKVVYEYANGLAARGHMVTVVHSDARVHTSLPPELWLRQIRSNQLASSQKYLPTDWFHVSPDVQMCWTHRLDEAHIPDGDVIVATGWRTAEQVARYSSQKGRKFYFIQHQETWDGPANRVMATWRLPLHKIVIARWLEQIATDLGETSTYVPNGFDQSRFGLKKPIESRFHAQVAMMYHQFAWKGSGDGVAALQIVKKRCPELQARLFGVFPAPKLPNWIEYVRNPKQTELEDIYNQAAIFIAPSWTEGFSLTPVEAMLCGAGLVATDNGGHREYAIHQETALLSPIKNPEQLAENIIRLVKNPQERILLAHNAYGRLDKFDCVQAMNSFEQTLLEKR
jgi:glycosyltransferase involved in cell wall biosynthesis